MLDVQFNEFMLQYRLKVGKLITERNVKQEWLLIDRSSTQRAPDELKRI